MNVQKSPFKTETVCGIAPSENLVEGRLSVPAEKADIGRVLLVQGKVHANAEPGDGKVFVDGTVKFFVVYMGPEGNIDSFESSSPFRHTENVDNAGAGMNVNAKGNMREIEYNVEDGRTLYVKGIAVININGSIPDTSEAVTALESPDTQTKTQRTKVLSTKDVKKDTASIREDLRIPQSMPKAQKILYSDAYSTVRSVKAEDLKLIIEGDIKMMILYLSEDSNAPLQYFYESLPFGSVINYDNASPDDTLIADTDLYDLSADIAEDNGDILKMSASVSVICTVVSGSEIEHIEDAYSVKNKLNIRYKDFTYKAPVLSGCVKAFTRSAISIPADQPSISRIVCMKASPVIVSSTPYADRVYIEGLMMFTICYSSPEGMRSFSGETPFESEAQLEGLLPSHQIDVNAEVEYSSFEGAGREISVKFMMDVMIKAYAGSGFRMISDIDETDENVPRRKGITIYFPDGDEDLWNIAKRYATTMDSVKKFNPDLGDNVRQGQKILIMG